MEPKIKSAFERELKRSVINKKKVIILVAAALIIGSIIGFSVGYGVGSYQTLKWSVGVAKHFSSISINEIALTDALNQLKIRGYYPNG